jgi:hemerythrin-like domain-containing protein
MTQQPELFRILIKQHREVDSMLTQLGQADDPETRGKLFPVLKQQLMAHAKAEEKTFYPALARVGEQGEAKHAKREHQDIERAIREVEALELDAEGWSDALDRLIETVEHHVEEEEGDVFEAALRSLDAETLDRLAEDFQAQRKEELERLGATDDGYDQLTKPELLEEARERGVEGRSSMTKDQLVSHLRAED